jgi:Spy/CpxP family protein refolding chaperone
MNQKRWIAAAMFAAIVCMTNARGNAQALPQPPTTADDQGPSDEDIKLFRKDLRSLKKQIIAANIDLTDTEAQQFWPIYDRYTAEMTKIVDRKFETIKEYAKNYNTINDQQADAYIKGRAEVEESILRLRMKYVPIFRKVLPGKTAALFIQMDWRLGLVMDLQLASQVPLIEP